MTATRPPPWLLAPVLTAFALFALSHRDVVFAALCSLVLLVAYGHRLSLAWPVGKAWWATVGIGLVTWVLCAAYYGAVMQSGAGLAYFQRIYYKPWLITTVSMMMALGVVWVWHVRAPARRSTRLILAWAGLMVVSSGNVLSLPPLYLPLLALFLGVTLLALVVLGGGLRGRRARSGTQWLWRGSVVLGCVVAISAGTWTVSVVLRLLEIEMNLIIEDVLQGSSYTDIIGVGDMIRLERRRRVALSRKVVATVDGAAWPGYLRTQVMTDYRRGRWKAEGSPVQPLDPVVLGKGRQRFALPQGGDAGLPGDATVPRIIHLLVNLRGAVPLPYAAWQVTTSAAASCAVAEGGIVQCVPPERLGRYRVASQGGGTPVPYGTGATLIPATSHATPMAELPEVRRARTAPEPVLARLRPLARRLVGNQAAHPLQAAQAIQHYFRRNYTYALDVRLAEHGDPIVDFVLHRRPAYCEYYASGLALMLRALGIPARVVGGFAAREYNSLARQWIVRQRDAHAWTEVFDARSGRWVAFDATPSSATAPAPAGGVMALGKQGVVWLALRAQTVLAWFRVTDVSSWLTDLGATVMVVFRRPAGMVTLGLGLMLAIGIRQRRRVVRMLAALRRVRLGRRRVARQHTDATTAEAQRLFDRVARALEARGLPIGHAETVEEYLDRVVNGKSSDGEGQVVDSAAVVTAAREPFVRAFGEFARAYTDLRFRLREPRTVEATCAAMATAPLTVLRQQADRVVETLLHQGT